MAARQAWPRLVRVAAATAVAAALVGCARVPPHAVLPDVDLGDAAFFPTLAAHTGARIIPGNAVEILLNGEEIFPAQLAAIRGARTTITFAPYFYADGAIAREFAEALAGRCRGGVGVKVLLDGFGSLGMPDEYKALMTRSGCHLATFRPVSRLFSGRVNNRNHRRILVVDGRVGFTGGSGISSKWMGDGRTPGHWRDTCVRVEGPVVHDLQAAFAEGWLEATGTVLGGAAYFPALTPAGTVAAQLVTSSPAKGDVAMYTMFLLALGAARESILITNPYFVPDARMTAALIAAVERGVRVAVLVPGEIDFNIVRQASRSGFGPLLRAGIEVYEYRAALLHAKTMVVDGRWATIGSTNLDNRSFALNAEANLVMYSPEVGRRMERIFASDLAHAARIDYARWRARPLWQRALEILAWPLRPQL